MRLKQNCLRAARSPAVPLSTMHDPHRHTHQRSEHRDRHGITFSRGANSMWLRYNDPLAVCEAPLSVQRFAGVVIAVRVRRGENGTGRWMEGDN